MNIININVILTKIVIMFIINKIHTFYNCFIKIII